MAATKSKQSFLDKTLFCHTQHWHTLCWLRLHWYFNLRHLLKDMLYLGNPRGFSRIGRKLDGLRFPSTSGICPCLNLKLTNLRLKSSNCIIWSSSMAFRWLVSGELFHSSFTCRALQLVTRWLTGVENLIGISHGHNQMCQHNPSKAWTGLCSKFKTFEGRWTSRQC